MESLRESVVGLVSPTTLVGLFMFAVMMLEVWLSRPDPMRFLSRLVQPRWALPGWAVAAVPFIFYALAIYALAKAVQFGATHAMALIGAVLIGNALLNYFLFRERRFDWAFLFTLLLIPLAAAAAYAVFRMDPLSGLGMVPIVLLVVYDAIWVRALARLNPHYAGPGEPTR